jgi:hypothetical protein
MGRMMKGSAGSYVMIALGVIGLVLVYSFRPPSGIGDAFSRLAAGQEYFLKEPVYYLGLIGFGLLLVFGVVKAIRQN